MKRNTSTRIISVSSGKGGVGKTNISVNLALALAEKGFHTCLFDADLGLANVDILLGLDPEYTIEHVISGERDLSEIVIKDFNGIDIISGGSGVEKLANLERNDIQLLSTSLGRLSEYDFLIFDTSAGVASPVIAFCMAATEVLLVITPEPTSMTDAYALLKVLFLNNFKGEIKIVVNQCRNIEQIKEVFNGFKSVVTHFLKINVSLVGFVLKDSKLEESVKKQTPFLLLHPNSNATKCIKYMARMLLSKEPSTELNQEMGSFWDKCFGIMKSRLITSDEDKTDHDENESFEKLQGQAIENEKDRSEEKTASIITNNEETISSDDIEIDAPAKEFTDAMIPKGNTSGDNNREIIDLMGQLVRSMKDISGGLSDINACLRNGHSLSVVKKDNPEPGYSYSTGGDAIILDYEEFLRNRI